jgi:hypothetical protein
VRPTSARAFTSLYLDDVILVAAVLIVAIVVTRIVEGVLAEVRADPRLRRAVFDGPAVVRVERRGDAVEVDVADGRRRLSSDRQERLSLRSMRRTKGWDGSCCQHSFEALYIDRSVLQPDAAHTRLPE